MKQLGKFLANKKIVANAGIDEKSVFYLFESIIREEYGKQGQKKIRFESFRGGTVFVRMENTHWNEEILLEKSMIIKRMNAELGSEEIGDIMLR